MMDGLKEFMVWLIPIVSNISLINNALLIVFFACFGFALLRESNNPNSPLHWKDTLLDKKTNRMSLGKLGQFVGLVISNWVIIFMVQKVPEAAAAGVLVWMFPMWLAYIGGTWAYNNYLKSNQGKLSDDTSKSNTTLPP